MHQRHRQSSEFRFKAMYQIHSRDYAGRYAMDDRTVYLIGANFNNKNENRGLEYEIEKLK
ncbi:MAG: hypothetical protein K2G85_08325 [Muribaculaceae bacterium]|nr:hypothetical protein [Muribaculaceae bacterium]